MPSQKAKYIIDGKAVYGFLFSHVVRMPNGRVIPHLFQVEGFTKDHAYKRLLKWKPQIPRSKIEFIDYLEPEHDVGYLGEKLPLFPSAANDSRYWVH